MDEYEKIDTNLTLILPLERNTFPSLFSVSVTELRAEYKRGYFNFKSTKVIQLKEISSYTSSRTEKFIQQTSPITYHTQNLHLNLQFVLAQEEEIRRLQLFWFSVFSECSCQIRHLNYLLLKYCFFLSVMGNHQ